MHEPDPRIELGVSSPAVVPAPASRSAPGRCPPPSKMARSCSRPDSLQPVHLIHKEQISRPLTQTPWLLDPPVRAPPHGNRYFRLARRRSRISPRNQSCLTRRFVALFVELPPAPRRSHGLRLAPDGLEDQLDVSSRTLPGDVRPRSVSGSSRPTRCRRCTRCPALHRTSEVPATGVHKDRSDATRSQSA